ncbi:MAG: hypothetical protein Q4G47_08055 [Lachnospiraceae bacterium]|nr:hypothetical protein [Lachnospiraceae bacterium]
MKKRTVKMLLAAAVIAAAAGMLLSGCTKIGSESKKAESDEVAPLDADDLMPGDIEVAPEEDDTVDQGREGRPTDSWNQEEPEDTETVQAAEAQDEGSDEYEPIDEDAESFFDVSTADTEGANRAN